MNTLNTILMLTMVLTLAAISSATSNHEEEEEEEEFFLSRDPDSRINSAHEAPAESNKKLASVRRFLGQGRQRLTCDNYPKACEESKLGNTNSVLCCNKKCVNVKTDKLNCGACGKRCKFSEICCNGRCVNPSANKNHCGGCGNSCLEGGFCAFGMCSYSYA